MAEACTLIVDILITEKVLESQHSRSLMEDAQNLYIAEWHFFVIFQSTWGLFMVTILNQDTDAKIQTLTIKEEETLK